MNSSNKQNLCELYGYMFEMQGNSAENRDE